MNSEGFSFTIRWQSGAGFRQGRGARRTTTGLVRTENQDRAVLASNEYGVFLGVFDGVGGSAAGGEAAELAFGSFAKSMYLDAARAHAGVRDELLAAAHAANRAVYDAGRATNRRISTTMTAGAVTGDRLGLVHVGDSRAYLFRDGVLKQLTRDHTMKAALTARYEAEGFPREVAERRARESGWSDMLVAAVGSEPEVEPDYVEVELRQGDVVLLSTDGVHGELEPSMLEGACEHVSHGIDVGTTCEALFECVRRAGAPDNATVVILAVGALS